MNLTLSLDDAVVERARAVALAQGKSLNQLIREYLEQMAAPASIDAQLQELRALSKEAKGRLGGQRPSRDELHERP